MSQKFARNAEERVMRVLSAFEPMSAKEYNAEVGGSLAGAHSLLERMRGNKQIHIAAFSYRTNGGPPTPHYAIGSHKDARPIKSTGKENSARSREKLKRERPEVYKARNKATWAAQKERLKDTEYRQRIDNYRRNWEREKNGWTPRILRNKDAMREIAIMFGITRDVTKRNRKKALGPNVY